MTNKWNINIGIAAEDKFYNSNLLKVYITSILPNFQNELSDQTIEEKININRLDYSDKKINIKESIKVKTSNIITAEYFGIFTNRTFSPDIRKGEQVLVLNLYNNDKHYWISLGRDDNLRQLEKFRLAISNDKRKVKVLSEDNTYYIELDTLHKKSILLRTSKSDNEKFRYLIHIDAKNNNITLEDDDDNYIKLKSDIPQIKLKNKNNAFVNIDKDDIFINAPRDLRINVGRMMVVNTNDAVFNNTEVFQINTNNFDVNASNITNSALTYGIQSNVKINGSLVSQSIRSPIYGTGSFGSSYSGPSINTDINIAKSNTANNSPDTSYFTGSMRHSAAWEQVKDALYLIADCVSQLGCNSAEIKNLADQSIMSQNQGS